MLAKAAGKGPAESLRLVQISGLAQPVVPELVLSK
jgi:hypothetical protein